MKKFYLILFIVGVLIAFTIESEFPIINLLGLAMAAVSGCKLHIFASDEEDFYKE